MTTSPLHKPDLSQSGRYIIRQQIAAGGMGDIYLADDRKMHRWVVLKTIRSDLLELAELQRRIMHECLLHARVGSHPNIVTLYDRFEAEGHEVLVMEYVHGETLHSFLKRYHDAHMLVPPRKSLLVVAQCLDGVSRIHEEGIVHRDLKPLNIMLSKSGEEVPRAKLLDFGIARLTDDAASNMLLTQLTGLTGPGTPYYMAPEQIDPEIYGGVCYATDIYAIGIILYEILCGERPFEGKHHQVYHAHFHKKPPPFEKKGISLPAAVEQIVMRALEKDPKDRFSSAIEMRDALRQLAGTVSMTSPSAGLAVKGAGTHPIDPDVQDSLKAPLIVLPGEAVDDNTPPVPPPPELARPASPGPETTHVTPRTPAAPIRPAEPIQAGATVFDRPGGTPVRGQTVRRRRRQRRIIGFALVCLAICGVAVSAALRLAGIVAWTFGGLWPVPPDLVASPAPLQVREGETVQIALRQIDLTRAIEVEATDLPGGASFDQTALSFSWTPGYLAARPNAPGRFEAVFTARDKNDPAVNETERLAIDVIDTNWPPVFLPVPDQSVVEGQEIVFQVEAEDADTDNVVQVSAGSLPEGATFDETTRTFRWIPGDIASRGADFTGTATFTAADNAQSAATTSIQVSLAVRDPHSEGPFIQSVPPQTVAERQLLQVALVVETDGAPESIEVDAPNLPAGAEFDPNTRSFSWTPANNTVTSGRQQAFNLEFHARDKDRSHLEHSIVVPVTVQNIPVPPVFKPLDALVVNEGQELRCTVSAADPEIIFPVEYMAETIPAGAAFDPASATFTWRPSFDEVTGAAEREATFLVTACYADHPDISSQQTVRIAVCNVNRPPVLGQLSAVSIQEGDVLTVKPTASDPDGDALTYSVDGTPSAAKINAETGEFTWKVPQDFTTGGKPASVVLSFSVLDSGLTDGRPSPLAATQTLNVEILHTNQPPEIKVSGPKKVAPGRELVFKIETSDVEGDAVDVRVDHMPEGAKFVDGVFTWLPRDDQVGQHVITFTATDRASTPAIVTQEVEINVQIEPVAPPPPKAAPAPDPTPAPAATAPAPKPAPAPQTAPATPATPQPAAQQPAPSQKQPVTESPRPTPAAAPTATPAPRPEPQKAAPLPRPVTTPAPSRQPIAPPATPPRSRPVTKPQTKPRVSPPAAKPQTPGAKKPARMRPDDY